MSQEESSQNEEQTSILSPSTSSLSNSTHKSSQKRRCLKEKKTVTEIEQKQAVLTLISEKLQNQNKYSNYAAYIGQELNELPPMIANYCQKLINDAMFSAKCGQLTAQSRIIIGSEISTIVYPATNSQQSSNTTSYEYNNQSAICQQPSNPQQSSDTSTTTWQQPPTTSSYYSNFRP